MSHVLSIYAQRASLNISNISLSIPFRSRICSSLPTSSTPAAVRPPAPSVASPAWAVLCIFSKQAPGLYLLSREGTFIHILLSMCPLLLLVLAGASWCWTFLPFQLAWPSLQISLHLYFGLLLSTVIFCLLLLLLPAASTLACCFCWVHPSLLLVLVSFALLHLHQRRSTSCPPFHSICQSLPIASVLIQVPLLIFSSSKPCVSTISMSINQSPCLVSRVPSIQLILSCPWCDIALLVPFVAVLLHIMTNGRLRRHQDPLLAVLQQWFIHHPFWLIWRISHMVKLKVSPKQASRRRVDVLVCEDLVVHHLWRRSFYKTCSRAARFDDILVVLGLWMY